MINRPCLNGGRSNAGKNGRSDARYRCQGNGRNTSWCRPKECEAEEIIASKTGLSSGKPVGRAY